MATTDATTTAEALRRVEEENGQVRRVLAHRHLRAAQVVRARAGGARRARGRHTHASARVSHRFQAVGTKPSETAE
jgi:hypothetical protein